MAEAIRNTSELSAADREAIVSLLPRHGQAAAEGD
jgi:hypothetical protein